MKKLLLKKLLLVSLLPVQVGATEVSNVHCLVEKRAAESIMMTRQLDRSLMEVLSVAKSSKRLVIKAWKLPVKKKFSDKEKAVSDFASAIYNECKADT